MPGLSTNLAGRIAEILCYHASGKPSIYGRKWNGGVGSHCRDIGVHLCEGSFQHATHETMVSHLRQGLLYNSPAAL